MKKPIEIFEGENSSLRRAFDEANQPHKDEAMTPKYPIGTKFEKVGGDYRFTGTIVASFTKLNGMVRYVGENEDGLLFIFNEGAIHPL